jgi:hypothetical protein
MCHPWAASAAYCRQKRNFALNCNWREVPTVEIIVPAVPKGKPLELALNTFVPGCPSIYFQQLAGSALAHAKRERTPHSLSGRRAPAVFRITDFSTSR